MCTWTPSKLVQEFESRLILYSIHNDAIMRLQCHDDAVLYKLDSLIKRSASACADLSSDCNRSSIAPPVGLNGETSLTEIVPKSTGDVSGLDDQSAAAWSTSSWSYIGGLEGGSWLKSNGRRTGEELTSLLALDGRSSAYGSVSSANSVPS